MPAAQVSKNQRRRAKKKADKAEKKAQTEVGKHSPEHQTTAHTRQTSTPAEEAQEEQQNGDGAVKEDAPAASSNDLEVKKDGTAPAKTKPDGPAEIDFDNDDPAFAMYKHIFTRFGASTEENDIAKEANAGNQGEVFFDDDNEIPDEAEETGPAKLSKKKRKMLNKLSVAELKALVTKPEVVEWHDTSSADPRLLVQIKAQRNVVPVPSHWSLKREYLSSKRGIEKSAFKLPKFIADTGIAEMRDAVLEKQAEQSLKQKQRERVTGKLGKLDIDYQKLYDAFFRFQEKPTLTRFGEVYYEGKEYETDLRHLRPGEMSETLKESLSIPPGAPPPWLIHQQRFGPPPSYPSLRIPGLNAPIPPGAQWGFNPGCWGKPPVDEYNRPLFGGDIFGIMQPTQAAPAAGEPVERNLWGELQPPEEESEEEEEDDEDEDEDEDEEDVGAGLQTPSGMETPGGMASNVPTEYGTQTEAMSGEFDLRKNRRGHETEESMHPRSAYTVVPERQARAEGFFGSDRTYDLSKSGQGDMRVLGQDDDRGHKRKKPGDIDVAVDPEALMSGDGLSKDELRRRYEEGRRDEGPGAQWRREEGLDEMIANESRKRLKRDEEKRDERKKYKF